MYIIYIEHSTGYDDEGRNSIRKFNVQVARHSPDTCTLYVILGETHRDSECDERSSFKYKYSSFLPVERTGICRLN